jgi:hypothetical protein
MKRCRGPLELPAITQDGFTVQIRPILLIRSRTTHRGPADIFVFATNDEALHGF